MCFSFYNNLWNEVCSRILINFWVNCTTFYSVSYSFYSQLQLTCWAVKSCCVKGGRCFNKSWQLMFWINFSISVLTDFWLIFISILIDILAGLWAAMNDVGWDWARAVMNEVNWHSAVHCKDNLIGLGWDDLIKQKLLYAQHYAHEVWFWTSLQSDSRNTNILFERRIVVTECTSWLL